MCSCGRTSSSYVAGLDVMDRLEKPMAQEQAKLPPPVVQQTEHVELEPSEGSVGG